MTKEEKALSYLNQFRECKFSSLNKPFSSSDSGMGFVLVYMYHYRKEVTAKELAEKMSVSKSRVTSLIQKMEERGLVRRETSKEDERVNIITLTEKGNNEGETLVKYSLNIVTRLMDEVGTDEIDHFIDTLFKIKDVLFEIAPCYKGGK